MEGEERNSFKFYVFDSFYLYFFRKEKEKKERQNLSQVYFLLLPQIKEISRGGGRKYMLL
jgi:hypothetical protein